MAKRCARRRKRSRGNQGLERKKGIRLERSGGAGLDRGASPSTSLAYPRRLNNRMISTLVAVNWSSVMADQTITHSSEAQIRSVIEAWAQAMRAKDAAGVVMHWDQDLVQFDLAPPLRTVGDDPQGLKNW